MRLTRHHSSVPSPQTVDDLLRPELESYSTSVLIAELARRGVFQSVPELPIEASRSTFGPQDGEDVADEEASTVSRAFLDVNRRAG